MNTPEPIAAPADPQPLGPEDFDALDDVLDALREQDEAVPDWEYCEGFLTALICTRREVAPEEYWPPLLGKQFQPMGHMEFVWRWKRRWREIESALEADVEDLADERSLMPEVNDALAAYLATPEDERPVIASSEMPAYGDNWARGFIFAVTMFAEDWRPPRDNEATAILHDSIDAIAQLLKPDPEPKTISLYVDVPATLSQRRSEAFSAAVLAVYDLYHLWKSQGEATTPIRREPTPGRNDPCPCGSGKKFKKCHGA